METWTVILYIIAHLGLGAFGLGLSIMMKTKEFDITRREFIGEAIWAAILGSIYAIAMLCCWFFDVMYDWNKKSPIMFKKRGNEDY